MKFKELFPDYLAYSNDSYLMNEVSYDFLKELSYKIPRLLKERASELKGLDLDGTFRNLCDIVSIYTNNEKTEHWGWSFIIRDFETQFMEFQSVKFHKFMDFIIELKPFLSNKIKDLNEIFEDNDFGYRLTNNSKEPWLTVNPSVGMANELTELADSTVDICKQTSEHILQAKEQLKRANESRARKDAIRDCLSAMEALMKKITNTKDIKDADKYLRNNSLKWGPREIIGDGIKIWNLFHRLYPDTRHGHPEITKLSYQEAIYFVDRILSFVKYISSLEVEEAEELF